MSELRDNLMKTRAADGNWLFSSLSDLDTTLDAVIAALPEGHDLEYERAILDVTNILQDAKSPTNTTKEVA